MADAVELHVRALGFFPPFPPTAAVISFGTAEDADEAARHSFACALWRAWWESKR